MVRHLRRLTVCPVYGTHWDLYDLKFPCFSNRITRLSKSKDRKSVKPEFQLNNEYFSPTYSELQGQFWVHGTVEQKAQRSPLCPCPPPHPASPTISVLHRGGHWLPWRNLHGPQHHHHSFLKNFIIVFKSEYS